MKDLFFKDLESLIHVASCCTIISYLALFIFIRVSGKRTLSKLNAFDFVVVVTLGSILSSMILMKVTIAEGIVALIIIITMQYVLAYFAKSSVKAQQIISSSPILLFYNGKFLTESMRKELITEKEIYAEIRKYRLHNMNEVQAVVMETNGEISVIKKSSKITNQTSLDDLS